MIERLNRVMESMDRVMKSLDSTQIEMRQQHSQQMDRLDNILRLVLTRDFSNKPDLD